MSDERFALETESIDDAEYASGLFFVAEFRVGGAFRVPERRQVERHCVKSRRGQCVERATPDLAPRSRAMNEQNRRPRARSSLLHVHVDVRRPYEATRTWRGARLRHSFATRSSNAESCKNDRRNANDDREDQN